MELTKLYWDQRKHPSRPPRLPEVSAFDRDLYFTQISETCLEGGRTLAFTTGIFLKNYP